MEHIWYAAYGSNLSRQRFAGYLGLDTAAPEFPADRWLTAEGRIRFAGHSRRWSGGVAFVDPRAAGTVMYRAYRVRREQFLAVWAAENGQTEISGAEVVLDRLLLEPEPGDMSTVATTGKYNAAAVVADGPAPMVTITTTRRHPVRPPADDYFATILAGLAEAPYTPAFRADYVDGLRRSP